MRQQMKSHQRRAREREREASQTPAAAAPADRALAIPVPVTLGALPGASHETAGPQRDESRAERGDRDGREQRDEHESEASGGERASRASRAPDMSDRERGDAPARRDARRTPERTKVQLPTARTTQTLGPQGGHATSAADRAPVMRMGESIPNTLRLENINVPSDAVIDLLQSLAIASGGGFGSDANFRGAGRASPLIESAINNRLSTSSVSGEFTETSGVNCRWSWEVTFRLLAPTPIPGGGTATVRDSTGGTGTVTQGTSTATTDSAKITGSGTGSSGTSAGSGGGPTSSSGGTVGAELGTSTTRTDQNSTSIGTTNGTTTDTTRNMVRYMAMVVVDAQVKGELDVSGSDYINPFKWGMYAGEAIDSMETARFEMIVGHVEFFRSNGIAPSAPAAPAMRKGWLEHELGLDDPSDANARKAANAAAVNPAQLSRSGARPLPSGLTAEAGERQGTDLSDVRVIRGGPADAYCDAMSAAAFTTLNPTGGSDIFMHSHVDMTSARGQHTLQHEIAHAAQLRKGEAVALSGLGGDAARRQQLEQSADEHANAALATTGPRPERKWTGQ